MLGIDKLDNTLLTCDQDNFSQITSPSRNRTRVTVVRDTCTAIVPPAPPNTASNGDILTIVTHYCGYFRILET